MFRKTVLCDKATLLDLISYISCSRPQSDPGRNIYTSWLIDKRGHRTKGSLYRHREAYI